MAENSFIKLLRYYTQKLKAFFLSKDILSFLLFLALSSAFWFVNALGKERETTINIPIRYVGLPQNIAITNSPPSEIILNVKDQGLQLFTYSKNHLTPLTIDLSRNFYDKGQILITPDQIRVKLGRYVLASTSILEVHPDSILVDYARLSQKKVPIELISSIELAPQYMLTDKIHMDPGQITIFGSKKNLDTIKSVRSEVLIVKNLNDTTILNCKLQPIKSVRFSNEDFSVTLYAEQFTEKKVQIPITTINCPDNLFIRTFPAVVNVTYNIGLSQFNSSNLNDIQVFLDYNDIKKETSKKQKLKIINNTSQISNIRIVPQDVEFILEEK